MSETADAKSAHEERLMERIGRVAGVFAERFVPDPWIYAVGLTFLAWGAAVAFTDKGPREVSDAWASGLWNANILVLIAQFSFNLLVCTAIARTPFVRGLLERVAGLPRSARSVIVTVALVSILLGLISWALCIVGGALFAAEACRQAKKRGIAVHYPLAIASGYIGMMTFGLGLTSSAPLIVARENHSLIAKMGVVPFSATVGTGMSLGVLASCLVVLPALLASMHPGAGGEIIEFKDPGGEASGGEADGKEVGEEAGAPQTFAARLETSPVVLKLGALLPVYYFVDHWFLRQKGIGINAMNLSFLCAALILFPTPRDMLRELTRASAGVWSIIFQFPFYAGVMGIISGTGLGQVVARSFVAISSETTWPFIGAVFSALCNLFVPSAGGQWLVSGEILVDTSKAFGFSPAQAVMIEVMGDQVTNMIQPMWALPALALSGLEARHIMGYTAVTMVVGFLIMVAGVTLFPV